MPLPFNRKGMRMMTMIHPIVENQRLVQVWIWEMYLHLIEKGLLPQPGAPANQSKAD
jgi:hypothetical protein